MEDTCLKDMQATRLSSLRTGKNLQVRYLSRAQQPIRWTPLSSGTPSSTLLLSSSSKIFRILTSIGVNPKLNNNTPAAHSPWLATFPRLQASSYKLQATSRKLQAFKIIVDKIQSRATSFKPQAFSCKRQAARAFIKFFIFVQGARNQNKSSVRMLHMEANLMRTQLNRITYCYLQFNSKESMFFIVCQQIWSAKTAQIFQSCE